VPVLDPGRGRTKTWCYARDDQLFGGKTPPAVLYCDSPDRKGEHPGTPHPGSAAFLEVDGYAGYVGL
jgi:transposase